MELNNLKNLIDVFKPDIVQLPLNVFDYRFKKKNYKKTIHCMKIEVQKMVQDQFFFQWQYILLTNKKIVTIF